MTPEEFREIRVSRYGTQGRMACLLGVSATMVCEYEHGKTPVPGDIEQTLLRHDGKIGFFCPKCTKNLVVVDWHDGPCCGACTKPLPGDDE